MWQELKIAMEKRGITIEIDDAVSELLCLPALVEQREGRDTMQAFLAFVETPLNRQFTDQRILAGDRVRVYRADNRIEFERIQEDEQ
jgi:ATP-dependent Clp protease ATP-binding subunit ClpA